MQHATQTTRQRTCRAACLATFAAAALALPGAAGAQTYTFDSVADNTGPFRSFGFPSINDGGTVAFLAFRDDFGVNQGIFTGSGGGPVVTVTDTDGPFGDFGNTPSINDGGTVAFFALRDAGGAGIFTGSGGGPTATVATTDGPFSSFNSGVDPSINAGGTVAFHAFRDAGGPGIFTGTGGGSTATVATTDGPFSGFGFGSSINDSGAVAFRAFRDAGGQGIFTGSVGGGPTATVATSDGPFSIFSSNPSINAGGTVAFHAFRDGGGEGIFTGSGGGGPVATVATTDGPFSSFGFFDPDAVAASINDVGTVAFQAGLDAGGTGIFTGPDPDADEVIGTGDALFGSTVTGLVFFREGLNDAGQVAFIYGLADGRGGIAVATVPEPAGLGLLALGGGALLARRRRR